MFCLIKIPTQPYNNVFNSSPIRKDKPNPFFHIDAYPGEKINNFCKSQNAETGKSVGMKKSVSAQKLFNPCVEAYCDNVYTDNLNTSNKFSMPFLQEISKELYQKRRRLDF